MKLGESRHTTSRILYLPKAVSTALELGFDEVVEFHTDGKIIYLVKQRTRGG